MCLSTKDVFIDIELDAWKYIYKSHVYWKSPYWETSEKRLYNKWYTGNSDPIEDDSHEYYPGGFHVCPTYEDAVKYMGWKCPSITRVKVRGIHTTGTQDGAKAWVASEIYVPRPRKKEG